MVLWCSSKNATLFVHMMCPGVQCLILDVVTIFDSIYNGDSHGNHSQRLQDSNHFRWNSSEKSRNFHGIGKQNGWGSSQLLSIEIPWNSAEFRLSTRNPQELMEEGKDLKKMVDGLQDSIWTQPESNWNMWGSVKSSSSWSFEAIFRCLLNRIKPTETLANMNNQSTYQSYLGGILGRCLLA